MRHRRIRCGPSAPSRPAAARARSPSAGTAPRGPSSRRRTKPSDANVLADVAVLSPGAAWAVGWWHDPAGDRTLIERWNGSSWVIVSAPAASGVGRLRAVDAVAPGDVWAVGSRGSTILVLHYDGSSVVAVPGRRPGSFVRQPDRRGGEGRRRRMGGGRDERRAGHADHAMGRRRMDTGGIAERGHQHEQPVRRGPDGRWHGDRRGLGERDRRSAPHARGAMVQRIVEPAAHAQPRDETELVPRRGGDPGCRRRMGGGLSGRTERLEGAADRPQVRWAGSSQRLPRSRRRRS